MVSVEGRHHGYCVGWAPWLVWRVGTMVSVEGGHHG